MAIRTIVVGYDDTAPARKALARAAELARALDARLVVTTVVPPDEAPQDWDETSSDAAAEELAHARELLRDHSGDVGYQAAVGEPADAIVAVAVRYDADLIIVGTRDPGPVLRMLGYSVSEGVLRQARCDVLVVRR